MKGLSVIPLKSPSWLSVIFGPLARALGEAENSLVVSLERERHWPRCQAAKILQKVNAYFMQNHEISGEKHQYPLVNVYITNWKDPPCYEWENPTISTGPCSIAILT